MKQRRIPTSVDALSQAFHDHMDDADRKYSEIHAAIVTINTIIPTLARIETTLINSKDEVDKISTKLTLQNGRIGKLERWRSYILGIFLVVSAVAGYILHNFFKLIPNP